MKYEEKIGLAGKRRYKMAKKIYRMLKAGEVVCENDELYMTDPVNKWVTGSLNVGKKLPANYVGAYRRVVAAVVKKKA